MEVEGVGMGVGYEVDRGTRWHAAQHNREILFDLANA